MLRRLEKQVFGHRYLRNVSTLVLDEYRCNGCGVCITVCPHGVLVIDTHKVRILDRDGCMECGACSRNCARQAITVRAGVGCLEAIVRGALTGSEPNCDCSKGSSCCG
jgi:ferredoxin